MNWDAFARAWYSIGIEAKWEDFYRALGARALREWRHGRLMQLGEAQARRTASATAT